MSESLIWVTAQRLRHTLDSFWTEYVSDNEIRMGGLAKLSDALHKIYLEATSDNRLAAYKARIYSRELEKCTANRHVSKYHLSEENWELYW